MSFRCTLSVLGVGAGLGLALVGYTWFRNNQFSKSSGWIAMKRHTKKCISITPVEIINDFREDGRDCQDPCIGPKEKQHENVQEYLWQQLRREEDIQEGKRRNEIIELIRSCETMHAVLLQYKPKE